MISTTFKWYVLACLLFWLVGAVFLFSINKGDWVIYLNQNRTELLDFFFKNWTHLGDGVFVLSFAVVLLFVKYRYSVIFAVTGAVQGLVSAVLKRVIFTESYRPKKFLADVYELQFVEGVDVHSYHSFPSGHTMTAFFVGGFLALVLKQRWAGLLLFVYALLVGISRNYLAQHFFEDIYVGSVVGVVITFVCWRLFRKKEQEGWLDGSLYKRLARS